MHTQWKRHIKTVSNKNKGEKGKEDKVPREMYGRLIFPLVERENQIW